MKSKVFFGLTTILAVVTAINNCPSAVEEIKDDKQITIKVTYDTTFINNDSFFNQFEDTKFEKTDEGFDFSFSF